MTMTIIDSVGGYKVVVMHDESIATHKRVQKEPRKSEWYIKYNLWKYVLFTLINNH